MIIYINGKACKATPGQSVLQVAKANNIYIPALCFHERTGPAGKCRACVVQVEGKPNLFTSCTLFATEGLRIITDSPEIRNSQKVVVDLMISAGKHYCMTCTANGACELQDAAYYLGIEKPSYDLEPKEIEIDSTSEFIVVDRSKCISCGRCVAGCNHTVTNEVLDFGLRGFETKVIFDADLPMGKSTCVQCGECVQLCPVGAIIDKRAVGKARNWELKKVETVCPYCGVGCKLELHIDERSNKIIKILGVEDSPTNNGMLCVKGRFGYDFVGSDERLTSPLIRENGKFREATWDEATSIVADKLNQIKNKYGSKSIAGLTSAKTTNEDNFAFQKFMRKEVGNNNVDHCARLCHSSTVAGLAASLGSGAMTNDIAGIKKAEVILIIGSDTSEAHPVIANRIKQAVRDGLTKLIVIDPKKIRIADYADIYVAQRPGTDVAVLNGIMQYIIKNELYDKDFVNSRCENFDELKNEVLKDKYSPKNVEKISLIPAGKLVEIAKMFASAKVASLYYAMGITQHTTGTDNVWSTANLQMLCGNIGIEGGGVNPLRGQSNVQGACDMGGLPNVYPGYQKVVDPKSQEKFENAWGTKLSNEVGLTVTEVFNEAHKGNVKALYVMGENPLLSDPDQSHIEEAIKNLEFLVVQDIFMTETAKFADVVLPAYTYAEKSGHFTNTERRVQRLIPAVKGPGEAKDDWEIIQLIANKMGGDWNYSTTKDITEEINKLVPQYGGITWERVGRYGLQWPCPNEEHPGTPILHVGKFARGLGKMKGIEFKEPAELPDDEYPLILTTGRVQYQFHTGTMSRKTDGLNNLAGPMVMLSVDDAELMNIENGEVISVSTRRGTIECPAFVTKRMMKGVVYVPFHYVEAAANKLTNSALDPIAKIPEFKVCAAKIQKIK
jgi:formate dehydrogenase major subunit